MAINKEERVIMKINFDIECTPEEARRLVGLPDVSPLNEMMVEQMKKRLKNGFSPEDIDAMMKAWMGGASAGLDGLQKAVFSLLPGGKKQ